MNLRGLFWFSPEDVIAKKACWSKAYTYDWFQKNTDGVKVDYADVYEDKYMSIVEKMWVTFNMDIITDKDKHDLAATFAMHVIPEASVKARDGLMVKRLWLAGQASDELLGEAAIEIWNEAKVIPEVSASAFACSRDPDIAINGSAVKAGGWFEGDVKVDEKIWQWDQVVKLLEGLYG